MCQLSEWEHQRGAWRGDGRGVMHVCALTASVCRVRVHWVRTGALTIWRVSHTPHRQQCSGVGRSCWEMSQPLEAAQPRLQQQQLCRPAEPRNTTICCWNTSRPFFFFNSTVASGNTLYQAFVYLSQQLRMTHQKKHHISLCCFKLTERMFNSVFLSYQTA